MGKTPSEHEVGLFDFGDAGSVVLRITNKKIDDAVEPVEIYWEGRVLASTHPQFDAGSQLDGVRGIQSGHEISYEKVTEYPL